MYKSKRIKSTTKKQSILLHQLGLKPILVETETSYQLTDAGEIILEFSKKVDATTNEVQNFTESFFNGLDNSNASIQNILKVNLCFNLALKILEQDPTNASVHFFNAKIFNAITQIGTIQNPKTTKLDTAQKIMQISESLRTAFEFNNRIAHITNRFEDPEESYLKTLSYNLLELFQLKDYTSPKFILKHYDFIKKLLIQTKDILDIDTSLQIKQNITDLLHHHSLYEEAIESIEGIFDITQEDPAISKAHQSLGIIYLSQNLKEKALEHFFLEAKILIPEKKEYEEKTLKELSHTYFNMGFYEHAILMAEYSIRNEFGSEPASSDNLKIEIIDLVRTSILSNFYLGRISTSLKQIKDVISTMKITEVVNKGQINIHDSPEKLALIQELMKLELFCKIYIKIINEFPGVHDSKEIPYIKKIVDQITKIFSKYGEAINLSRKPLLQEQKLLKSKIGSNEHQEFKIKNTIAFKLLKAFKSYDGTSYTTEFDDFIKLCAFVQPKDLEAMLDDLILRNNTCPRENRTFIEQKLKEYSRKNISTTERNDSENKLIIQIYKGLSEFKSLLKSKIDINTKIKTIEDYGLHKTNITLLVQELEILSETHDLKPTFTEQKELEELIDTTIIKHSEITQLTTRLLEINQSLQETNEISKTLSARDSALSSQSGCDPVVVYLPINGMARQNIEGDDRKLFEQILEHHSFLIGSSSVTVPKFSLIREAIGKLEKALKTYKIPKLSYLTITANYMIIESKLLMIKHNESKSQLKRGDMANALKTNNKILDQLYPSINLLSTNLKHTLGELYLNEEKYIDASDLLLEVCTLAESGEILYLPEQLAKAKIYLAVIFAKHEKDELSYSFILEALKILCKQDFKSTMIDNKKLIEECALTLQISINCYDHDTCISKEAIDTLNEIRILLKTTNITEFIANLTSFIGMMHFIRYEKNKIDTDKEMAIAELESALKYYSPSKEISPTISKALHPHSLHIILSRAYTNSNKDLALKYASDSLDYCNKEKFALGVSNCILARVIENKEMEAIHRKASFNFLLQAMHENPYSSWKDTAAAYLMENAIYLFKFCTELNCDAEIKLSELSKCASIISLLNDYVTTDPFYEFATTYIECYLTIKPSNFTDNDNSKIRVFADKVDIITAASPNVSTKAKISLYKACEKYYRIAHEEAKMTHCIEILDKLEHKEITQICEIFVNDTIEEAVAIIGQTT